MPSTTGSIFIKTSCTSRSIVPPNNGSFLVISTVCRWNRCRFVSLSSRLQRGVPGNGVVFFFFFLSVQCCIVFLVSAILTVRSKGTEKLDWTGLVRGCRKKSWIARLVCDIVWQLPGKIKRYWQLPILDLGILFSSFLFWFFFQVFWAIFWCIHVFRIFVLKWTVR